MIFRNDDVFKIEVAEGKGYIIRLNGYTGFTVTITENLRIVYSSSSKMPLTVNKWIQLNNEINNGIAYMKACYKAGICLT